MAHKLLLIEDVENLGRSGDLVSVKPGYARNFLLPQGVAVLADKRALRMRARLQEEREKKAAIDKSESEKIAAQLAGVTLTSIVKVDHEGHMYGSVSITDIVHLLSAEHQIELEKRSVGLKHPIKALGVYTLPVKLKEGVTGSFTLKVISEEASQQAAEADNAEKSE
ncbi:50S ribosomal protein L9 [Parachlamydia sp. AcF125]|uniref:50S ribosomal protein L9 n=1 Tax=Parachlamydia sp. AcF125 TaxID=2795736 RepID=UPI001BC8FCF0|nr:50S ribosomal protein L9 [Parachlamydia sp. AcF125]MBS4168340.1 50S ribosomal protein L9 [Parachlamydia sp. AcF125]